MSLNYKLVFIFICGLVLTGCIQSHYVENVDQLIASSPQIEMLSKSRFEARTDASQIGLFYHYWNPLTRPDAVKNWKYLYIMGETSEPSWSYTQISKIVVAQRDRDDDKAVTEMRQIAARQGGDALVDLYREPMIDAPKFGARIIGFRYYGIVARQN